MEQNLEQNCFIEIDLGVDAINKIILFPNGSVYGVSSEGTMYKPVRILSFVPSIGGEQRDGYVLTKKALVVVRCGNEIMYKVDERNGQVWSLVGYCGAFDQNISIRKSVGI